MTVRVAVLLDLDGQHFAVGELLVEKLDGRAQLGWDGVRNEDQTEMASVDVLADALPEALGIIGVPADLLGTIQPLSSAARGEPLLEPLNLPVRGPGGVVQHLAHDLPADPRVGRALDLHEHGHALVVQEQVIDDPVGGDVLVVIDRCLAPDEQQRPAFVPCERRRALGDQLLQHRLSLVRRFGQTHQLTAVIEEDP